MDSKKYYRVNNCGKDADEGFVLMSEEEAKFLSYVTDSKNWKFVVEGSDPGVFSVDLKYPLDKEFIECFEKKLPQFSGFDVDYLLDAEQFSPEELYNLSKIIMNKATSSDYSYQSVFLDEIAKYR